MDVHSGLDIKKIKDVPFLFFAVIVFVGMGIQTYSIEFPFLNNSASRGYISFFAGLIYAYFAKKIDIEKIWIQILAAFAFCGTILGLKYSLFGMSENNVVFVFWPSLLVIMNSKLVKKVIRGEFWSKWAEISFDVYIWHMVWISSYSFLGDKYMGWVYSVKGMVVTVVVLQLVGLLSNRLFERPINKYL